MEFDLRQLIGIARRWWWLMLLAPAIAGATAYYSSSRQTPLYAATALLQINPAQTSGAADWNAVEGSKGRAETYRQLVTVRPVLEKVEQDLSLPYGADELADKVTARAVTGTYLVEVRVSDPSPQVAAVIADAVAEHFVTYTVEQAAEQRGPSRQALDDQIAATREQVTTLRAQIDDLERGSDASAASVRDQINQLRAAESQQQLALNALLVSANEMDLSAASAQTQVQVSEKAAIPSSPYAPQTTLYTIFAVFAGLLIAAGPIFLLEYLDNTVKADADFPALINAPMLATVGKVEKLEPGHDQLFLLNRPKESAAEAIRVLRANIEFAAAAQEITTLAVSSAGPSEGKSTLTANLGVAMAQAGFSTVIIDADLRRPSQHQIFDVSNERGLTTLLTHQQQPWSWVATRVSPELSLIPSGPLPPNPSDLLSLDHLGHLLKAMANEVDVILLDTPPILAVSDPLVVATNVDGVILTCRAGRTRVEALRRAAAALQQGGVRVIGVVLNQQTGRGGAGYYYYPEYYGPDSPPRGETAGARGAPATAD